MLNQPDHTHQVMNEDKPIPVIAFFGTKGGVGKTTIVDKFSTIVARAAQRPNILMVDFDVHHRGLTVLRTKDQITDCRTIHEYIADSSLEFQKAQDVTRYDPANTQGREYLIPSSKVAAERVFSTVAKIKPSVLVQRLKDLLKVATQQYDIDLILVDCGPIVDPLTASAAHMSNMAFIIGQNEPITIQSLQNYAIRIRDFLPDFDASKVLVILNKVRGPVLHRQGIYASIPFTMEVVDYSEGLPNIDEIRLIYLDYCVYNIITRVFGSQDSKGKAHIPLISGYKTLVPGAEAVLTENQKTVIDTIEKFPSSRWYQRLQMKKSLFIAGAALLAFALATIFAPKIFESLDISEYGWLGILRAVLLVLGSILIGLGAYLHVRIKDVNKIILLKEKGGYEGLLELLTTRESRQKFDNIRKWSEQTRKEIPNES